MYFIFLQNDYQEKALTNCKIIEVSTLTSMTELGLKVLDLKQSKGLKQLNEGYCF